MKFFSVKSFYLLVLVNLIFGAALLAAVYQYNEFIRLSEEKEKEKVIDLTKKAAQELNSIAKQIEESTIKMAASFSEQPTPDASYVKKILSDELDSNNFILGCGIFYAPYAYSKENYLFGPYLYRDGSSYELKDVGMSYDYTSDTKKSHFFL
jgi:methyl-accepting chemotaxis protein